MIWLAALAWGLVASPEPEGRLARAPIEMSSDGGIRIDLRRRTGTAEGHVVIRRRDLVVCCDRAVARYGSDRISEVTCRGNVVIHRADGMRIMAAQARFVADRERLVLTGGVRVWREEGYLSGQRIEFDLARDRLDVRGPGSTLVLAEGATPPPSPACPRPASAP